MKIRAAVLEEFGEPLVVQEVELAEPRAGEVLVRLVACGVCHTDLYTASGADPSGYAPTVLGHEGAGVVERVGADVTSVAPGDHVVTLFSPQCRECVHCRSDRTNLCLAIREQQNKGYLPDGTTRLGRERRADPPLHGDVDVRGVHGHARDRAGEGQSRGAARARVPVRLRPLDRARRGDEHRQGRGRLDVRRLRRRAWSGSARSPAAGLRAPSGSSPSTSRRTASSSRAAQGATDTLAGGPDIVDEIVEMTDGFGADYTFEATGNVDVMRQAVESARMGWGLCTVAGVAGKGETLDIVPRFLITGRRVAGSSFGGVKGRDQVPAARRARARRRHRRRRRSSRTASRSTTSTAASS